MLWVAGEFRKSSDIKSLKKKQQIQAILEHFSKYFDGLESGFNLYSIQFFVDSEEGHFFELDKDQIEIINRYHKRDMAVFEENRKSIGPISILIAIGCRFMKSRRTLSNITG